uniref:Lipoprotein n=1 Tax=Fundidesulfovibrio putealis TaxID=270496 RepID=A0A7C3WCD3_9BACT
MRCLVIVVCAALLCACSGRPTVVNPNKTPAQAQADYDDCRGNASVAAALRPSDKDPEAYLEKRLDDCMKSKGYKVD